MRQIIRVRINGVPIVGTCHRPAQVSLTGPPPSVLLINFGQVCRSGPANMSTEIADRLCECGYPVFRFDLPGLGDTPGDLPEYHETYWRFVESGGQAPWVCSLLRVLSRECGVSRVVLGGLCGGAVTSIFVAEQQRTDPDVVGLLLMEPAVRSTPAIRNETMEGTLAPVQEPSVWGRVQAYRCLLEHRLRLLMRSTRFLDPVRRTCQIAERRLWSLHGRPLPAMMNAPLIRSWQRVQATGLPILVMSAPGSDREFIKHALFPEASRKRMAIVDLDYTNHLFTAGDGKLRAIEEAQRWMCSTYAIGASSRLADAEQRQHLGQISCVGTR